MGHRAKVLLLIPHLEGGGAEKVIAQLASSLDGSKYSVHLGVVTHSAPPNPCFSPHLTVHSLRTRRVRWSGWRLLRLIRRIKPDLVVSGMAHLSWMLLVLRPLLPRRVRVVARQNGSLRHSHTGLPSRALYRWLYPRADAVVCQSQAMAEEVHAATGGAAVTRILPNPVDVEDVRACGEATRAAAGAGPHLLAVGRLAPEKGFDHLLHALSILRQRHPEADLTILGEGAARQFLEDEARRLAIAHSVHFAGWVDDTRQWFAAATLFVLSSRHDALPNALLEAAAAGLPIVTTRASEGLMQLVESQRGVWIAEENSPEGLSLALEKALEQIAPGQRFPHPWIEPFRKNRALRQWEAFIDEFLTTPHDRRPLAHQSPWREISR